MQITEAIRMQMEVQHRLQEQLEVVFRRTRSSLLVFLQTSSTAEHSKVVFSLSFDVDELASPSSCVVSMSNK